MNKEQALSVLQSHRTSYRMNFSTETEFTKAMDIAIKAMEEYAAQNHSVDTTKMVTDDEIQSELWKFRQDAMSWIDDVKSYNIFEKQLLNIINSLHHKRTTNTKCTRLSYSLSRAGYGKYIPIKCFDNCQKVEWCRLA